MNPENTTSNPANSLDPFSVQSPQIDLSGLGKGVVGVGRFGAIWAWDEKGNYFVFLNSARVNNKYRAHDLITAGDETGFVCNEAAARVWLKRIGMPASLTEQARLFNEHSTGRPVCG